MSTSNNVDSVVLDLIKEYLSKKPFFSIEDIVTFINYRVKRNPYLNKNSIEMIIKKLIKKRVLIPGTKLMKTNVVEHPIRNEIYNHIRKHPSNINEIMRSINIGSNQALWHISCLEKFQLVRSKMINNQRIIFDYNSDPEHDELHYYLNSEIVQNIINFMQHEDKTFKITEIANGLNKNYNTIKKYLTILTKLKLLIPEKEKNRLEFKLDTEKYNQAKKHVLGDLK